uniref:ABC transporter permease n=1 Tax=Orrella sp. TaxID=1921583 RepID=UPI0040486D6C
MTEAASALNRSDTPDTPENPTRVRPLRSPWQISQAVWYALILREIQTMFLSRRFGAFWVLAEPIAHITVMMSIFSFIRDRMIPGVPFALWLLAGLVPFFMMRGIIFGLMGAVSANQSLFTYRQVKPFDTYIARCTVQVMTNAAVYLILGFGLVFFFQYAIPVYQPLQMMVSLAVMVFFAFGLGVVFSLLTHAVPDIAPVLRLVFFPLYLLSGVIFPIRWVPQPYYDWLLWNPFLHLIDMFRQYSFEHYTPLPGVNLQYPAQCALVALFIAALAYRRRQYDLVTA